MLGAMRIFCFIVLVFCFLVQCKNTGSNCNSSDITCSPSFWLSFLPQEIPAHVIVSTNAEVYHFIFDEATLTLNSKDSRIFTFTQVSKVSSSGRILAVSASKSGQLGIFNYRPTEDGLVDAGEFISTTGNTTADMSIQEDKNLVYAAQTGFIDVVKFTGYSGLMDASFPATPTTNIETIVAHPTEDFVVAGDISEFFWILPTSPQGEILGLHQQSLVTLAGTPEGVFIGSSFVGDSSDGSNHQVGAYSIDTATNQMTLTQTLFTTAIFDEMHDFNLMGNRIVMNQLAGNQIDLVKFENEIFTLETPIATLNPLQRTAIDSSGNYIFAASNNGAGNIEVYKRQGDSFVFLTQFTTSLLITRIEVVQRHLY